jgi:hypothetical protein
MCRNFLPGKYRYSLQIIFLIIIIFSGLSNISSSAGSFGNYCYAGVAEFSEDTVRQHVNDTSRLQGKDSASTQAKDTENLHPGDTSRHQIKDSLQSGAADSTLHPVPDSIVYKQKVFSAEELIRGERLFYGLVYLDNNSVNCAQCHNTAVSDTLNWNPDALEISRKYTGKSAFDLSKVLLKPMGKKMKLVHKGYQLSAKDIVLMKAFMDKFVLRGLKPAKPVLTNLLLLIIASVLFLISVTDLILKKIFKDQRITWAILTVTGIFITWILAVNAVSFGRSKGFAPAQPIKFSHAVHAGQNKTDCNYCHYSAKISKTAGIPPGSICLNCHLLVRNGTRSGATEIAKVVDAFEKKIPVKWVRIYRLPDFVFFSHEQHVSAGQINCEDCHGSVKEMDRLSQVPDLSMGWCIDCHKTRKVNISNEYYKTYYSELYDSVRAGKIDSIRVIGIGGRDCGKCHY